MCYHVNCIHHHNHKHGGFQIALLHFILLVLPIYSLSFAHKKSLLPHSKIRWNMFECILSILRLLNNHIYNITLKVDLYLRKKLHIQMQSYIEFNIFIHLSESSQVFEMQA